MTQEEIIRMAQQVQDEGFAPVGIWPEVRRLCELAFAAGAAHERERMKWDGIHTCSDVCDKPACVARRNAVLAEREACAKVCEKAAIQMNYSEAPYKQCAAAIRARGE